MHIKKIIAKHVAEHPNKPHFSFEYFPPKTDLGVENLYTRLERMNALNPAWFDVTWGAGGSTSDLTLEIVAAAENQIGRTTCMHLTCTNMPVSEIERALQQCKKVGIQNILALRGDPPRGEEWKQIEGGFSHAVDLVRHIRKNYGDFFCIAVAGYPEGHEQAESKEADLQHLKEKVDAGADLVITQLFYDADLFIQFVKDCRAVGINVPVLPGIMPIQTYAGFVRMTELCKTSVPQFIHDALEPIRTDEEKVKEYGVELATQTCSKIWEARVTTGFHFYTLNLEKSVHEILKGLNLVPKTETARPALPWSRPDREGESVRPIFWSKRPVSYLKRTETWDEFPNGRWGDARSPAYGDLSDFHLGAVPKRIGSVDRLDMWGADIQDVQEIHDVFASFCEQASAEDKLISLPWCEEPLDAETAPMRADLVRANKGGFMTINSQAAINGLPSTDRIYGWGPEGGYIYSKAYIEFFVSPALFVKLQEACKSFPMIQYHAVNLKGDSVTSDNTHSPTMAVSWGVFPGREIQQPTVVDQSSFMVWRTEAFTLWQTQWANLYDEASKGRQIIDEITNTYWLVNLVDNDYFNGNVFAPVFACLDN